MKAVLRRTGLTAETLRSWERRYKAVEPRRTNTGRRIYSERELSRLLLLAELSRAGHSIGRIASLSDRELSALSRTSQLQADRTRLENDVQATLTSLEKFDFPAIRLQLVRIRHEMSPRDFMFHLVPQLMREVGRLIVAGKLNVAQEHALSEVIQHQLKQVYEGLQSLEATRKPARTLIFAAPEGQLHEVGLTLVATMARFQGFRTQYLGPNLPAEDLAGAALRIRPNALVLSITALPEKELKVDLNRYIARLLQRAPKSCDVWIGGSGALGIQPPPGVGKRMFRFETIGQYEEKLSRF